jgi:Transcriptional Coactivator p15 (PC4)
MRKGDPSNRLDICSDPQFATRLDNPLAEPLVIFQLWKGRQRNECIRLTISRYNGKPIGDLRVFFTTKTGHMQASKKGIAFAIAKLPELRKALQSAEAKAIELNLIEAVS